MPRLSKVKMVSNFEKHISLLSENVEVLPYLRKDNLKIILDTVSYMNEEITQLRNKVDRAKKMKKIRTKKRVEKKAISVGLIKNRKRGKAENAK